MEFSAPFLPRCGSLQLSSLLLRAQADTLDLGRKESQSRPRVSESLSGDSSLRPHVDHGTVLHSLPPGPLVHQRCQERGGGRERKRDVRAYVHPHSLRYALSSFQAGSAQFQQMTSGKMPVKLTYCENMWLYKTSFTFFFLNIDNKKSQASVSGKNFSLLNLNFSQPWLWDSGNELWILRVPGVKLLLEEKVHREKSSGQP